MDSFSDLPLTFAGSRISGMSDPSIYLPESVLVIMAHPDDIEFTCAGTIAHWVKQGTRAGYVICTSGDVGIADLSLTRQQVAEIRETEARNAAAAAGVTDVVFLHEPDGLLNATLELRMKLVREIRRFKPEVVICGDPTAIWSGESRLNHPDHRAAALAAVDAAFPAAGQPHLFEELREEGLEAHKPRKVFIARRGQNDTYINIDDSIEVKIQALRAHKSQMGDWDPSDRIKQWAAEIAEGKEMQYAESFRTFTLESDETWQKLHPNS
ncbi:MAG: PIG-L deacetylase family protein [Anaerolineaceae bacterium]|jgi:LmbE family N-acetylglucosaminyl deacetylase